MSDTTKNIHLSSPTIAFDIHNEAAQKFIKHSWTYEDAARDSLYNAMQYNILLIQNSSWYSRN